MSRVPATPVFAPHALPTLPSEHPEIRMPSTSRVVAVTAVFMRCDLLGLRVWGKSCFDVLRLGRAVIGVSARAGVAWLGRERQHARRRAAPPARRCRS